MMVGNNQTEVKLKEYRYTGKECDDFTGLYYYGARYYASWLGRWLTTDPIMSEGGSLDLYVYCNNNPVNRVDPDGKEDNNFLSTLRKDLFYRDYTSYNSQPQQDKGLDMIRKGINDKISEEKQLSSMSLSFKTPIEMLLGKLQDVIKMEPRLEKNEEDFNTMTNLTSMLSSVITYSNLQMLTDFIVPALKNDKATKAYNFTKSLMDLQANPSSIANVYYNSALLAGKSDSEASSIANDVSKNLSYSSYESNPKETSFQKPKYFDSLGKEYISANLKWGALSFDIMNQSIGFNTGDFIGRLANKAGYIAGQIMPVVKEGSGYNTLLALGSTFNDFSAKGEFVKNEYKLNGDLNFQFKVSAGMNIELSFLNMDYKDVWKGNITDNIKMNFGFDFTFRFY
jgi:RHS repeat-associated protein